MQDIAAGRLNISGRYQSTGDTGELKPYISDDSEFNAVLFLMDGVIPGSAPYWGIPYFEGKSNRITFRQYNTGGEIAEITSITLRPAPTMAYLNPRPAPDSLPYPWRWDGGEHNHDIKLPLPLTYVELSQGSQIVVSGVTDSITVIEGVIEENNQIRFRAGGLLIASVQPYNGERDLVKIIVMEEFTGAILAVNFTKAYKNLPIEVTLDENEDGVVSYLNGQNTIAKCVLNNVAIYASTPFIPLNGLLGNLVFQSQYIENYGNVIESYYWANGRYLYIIRLDDGYNIQAVNQEITVSPLVFPIL